MRHLIAMAIAVSACGGARRDDTSTPVDVDVGDAGTLAPLAVEPRREPSLPAEPGVRVIDPARDPRRSMSQPRSTALVEVEALQLDRLLAATPSGSPDRPALLRRVAEDYCELARGREIARAGEVAPARNRAIEAYSTWVQETPAGHAGGDEVRYFLGLEHERTGNLHEARRAYYDLIKLHPASKYVPAAYFAFGEMFFSEARGDTAKIDLARQAYQECLTSPPPGNWLFELAKQRLEKLTELQGSLRVP